MFRKFTAVVLLLCISFSLFALDMSKAEPYKEIEFPKWSRDLRRAEIIFFGAIPLAYPATNFVLGTIGKSDDFWHTLGYSCAVAGAIVLTDFIIGLINEN